MIYSQLESAKSKLKSQDKAERILCVSICVTWVIALIAMIVCFVISLSVYPQRQSSLSNKSNLYEFSWEGGTPGTCSVCNDVPFMCTNYSQNMTRYFALPSDWDFELTKMDDAFFTMVWTTFDCGPRYFLTVYSNDIEMHFQELDLTRCSCGVCMETVRFMESGFHQFVRENSTIWAPRINSENTIVFQISGGSVCVTRTKLQIRYSTDLFKDYASIVDKIWWGGFGLAIFTVVIPMVLFGQAVRICTRPKTGLVKVVGEKTPLLDDDAYDYDYNNNTHQNKNDEEEDQKPTNKKKPKQTYVVTTSLIS